MNNRLRENRQSVKHRADAGQHKKNSKNFSRPRSRRQISVTDRRYGLRRVINAVKQTLIFQKIKTKRPKGNHRQNRQSRKP